MCTSFVYRKDGVFVGMNFDNDGKDFEVSSGHGGAFLVSVKANNTFFPSFGVNRNGVFVNDLMVDLNGTGKYKRQSDKRWVTTSLINYVMGDHIGFDDVKNVLQRVEIVNAPHASTHNLIADRQGKTCVVEPGRGNLYTEPHDSDWYVMTNFPLSDYDEIVPHAVTGSGTDRYLKTLERLATVSHRMSVEQGFEVLKSVVQTGPVWRTELSLIYDGVKHELSYCVDQRFDEIAKHDFGSQEILKR